MLKTVDVELIKEKMAERIRVDGHASHYMILDSGLTF